MMLKMCDDDHPAIAYAEASCPACELLVQLENLKDAISELKEYVTELKIEVAQYAEEEDEED